MCLVAQWCLTLCDSMDYSPPGSSVYRISQARALEWGCHFLLQGIFLTQGSNSCLVHLLHWQVDSLPLAPPGNATNKYMVLCIFKSRDIILPAKVCLVKAMVFPMVMYGCERWTIKKAECQRIDVFELWCWRRLLKEIKPVHPKGNQS